MTTGTALACILVADFITGLVHWIEDTYGVPSWPLIGKSVIQPNIEHHKRPGLIGSMGSFFGRNYQPALLAIAVSLGFYLTGTLNWHVAVIALAASFGNEIHTWAHRKDPGKIVRFLHSTALVMTPQQHARHHRPPYTTYFCTITNLLNPILELIWFWKSAEWVLSTVFGVTANRMTKEREFV